MTIWRSKSGFSCRGNEYESDSYTLNLLWCQREHGYGSLSPDPDLQERDHDHEGTSPILNLGFIHPKQGNISGVSNQSLERHCNCPECSSFSDATKSVLHLPSWSEIIRASFMPAS